MLETAKEAGEAQVALLCVWPHGSHKVRRESDYLAKFKEKQWEKMNKNSLCGKGLP